MLALVVAGCHAGSKTAGEVARARQAQGPVPAPAGQPNAVAAAPLLVSNEKLDRYLAYQDATLKGYLATIAEAQKLSGPSDAGVHQAARGLALIRAQQAAEQAARERLGLTEAEVTQLQRVVSEVITRRKVASMVNYDAQLKQFETLRAQLPADQRASLTETIASLQQQRDETVQLTEERRQYGDANIDAVLAREKELAAAQDRWVQAVASSAVTSKTPSGTGASLQRE